MEATRDVDEETLEGLVAALESRGLIHLSGSMGGTAAAGAMLTDIGRTAVRARQGRRPPEASRDERRSNPKPRAIAARDALLDWCYTMKRHGHSYATIDGFLGDVRGHFEGDRFT